MKQGECYEQALAKHDWANKHIQNLQGVLHAFRQADPCTIPAKVDPKTGDVTYYVAHIPNIPREVSLVMGDVLHNLRCALDYVACGLVGPSCVTSKTKFPIRRDPHDWEVSGLRMVDGASKEAIEQLRRIRPYETGNTLLYILHTLNNIDKHRLLLTVSLNSIGRTLRKSEQVVSDPLHEIGSYRNSSGVLVSIQTGDGPSRVPLYAGQELLTVPAAEAEEKVGFFVEVAFGEPGPAKGVPIIITLQMVSDAVSRVIRELAPFLP